MLLLPAAIAVAGCRSGVTRGEILFADGLDRLALGDTAQAILLLQESAYHAPGEARAFFHCGRLLAGSDRIEDRARAEKALRRAIELDPGVGLYAETLGSLLRKQGFMHESTRSLRRAVEIDPGLAHAWLLLGLNLQIEYQEDPTSEALRDSTLACFDRAFTCAPENEEARYRLAYLSMARGDLQRARELVRPLVDGRECPGRFAWLLAAIESRGRRFELAGNILESALRCLGDVEREELVGLSPLLHPDSALVYRSLAPAVRDSLCRDYWWRIDPTPTTLLNERFVEHVARRVDAGFYFEVLRLGLPGHRTDRGEIYLRYGAPAEANRVADAEAPAWEWHYTNSDGEDMDFVFLDTFRNGNYTRRRRGATSDFMRLEPMEARPQRTSIAFQPPPRGWRHVLRYFRGEGGAVAVEIAYAVGPDSLLDGLQLEAAGWRRPGELAARRRGEVRRSDLYRLDDGSYIGRLRFEVPREPLELGLQLTGLRAGAGGPADAGWVAFGRDTLAAPVFDSERVELSDLLLAHAIWDGGGGLFDMGGTRAIPRVESEIQSGLLHLYFEIYTPDDFWSQPRPIAVTYRVQAAPPGAWSFGDQFRWNLRRRQTTRPAVETSFVLQPREAIERQRLSIDVSSLAPGRYTLSVEVQDTAGGEGSERSTDFRLPSPVSRREP